MIEVPGQDEASKARRARPETFQRKQGNVRIKSRAIAALTVSSFLLGSGSATAAKPSPDDYAGKRLNVDVEQLLFYTDPAKSYDGSLQRGQSFKVSRLSPSGTYAYGIAYGHINKTGWVRTSGLDETRLTKIKPAATGTVLAGTPRLYTVQGDVDLGRPTRYVTFKTAKGANARLLVITVSGSSGRTYNADDGRSNRSVPRSRTCFRSSLNPYQRTPEPRRLKPGVAYKVRFYARESLNGERALFATRTLRARSYSPQGASGGGSSAPSPCK